jgi:hypothetical protein
MINNDTQVVANEVAEQLTPKMIELLCKTNALQDFLKNFNPYCSIKDLSACLRIPYGTLQTWVAQGKIPCDKVAGQDPKIYLKDLQTFVASKELKK